MELDNDDREWSLESISSLSLGVPQPHQEARFIDSEINLNSVRQILCDLEIMSYLDTITSAEVPKSQTSK